MFVCAGWFISGCTWRAERNRASSQAVWKVDVRTLHLPNLVTSVLRAVDDLLNKVMGTYVP